MGPEQNFGWALEVLKHGGKVTREGWNGKGMYLYLVPANSYAAQTEVAREEFGESVPYRAYIALKTAQGDVAPWSINNTDVLEIDWEIVE